MCEGSVQTSVEHTSAPDRLELLGASVTATGTRCDENAPDRNVAVEGVPHHRHGTVSPVSDLSLLRNVDLFGSFSDDEHRRLADAADLLDLIRNDVLFVEGEEAAACYVVTSGRIAISNRSVDGRESMFALMERGDLFGEMGLFDGLGRSAEARALESSQAIRIPYEALRAVWDDRPDLLWSVVQLLSQRIRSTDEALADAFFLDVTGRTAKHLLEIAGDQDEFEIPITQEELAGLVGASRERVNKAIASFLKLGWIDQQDRHYRILNRRELEIRST
ncbi:MAG: Crp/Fnr family transcriptional regulator [Actinobacteria bacterium]|nr:Crp/Fnr family transcriptional regulator [Actinomycetota bacterium]